MRDVESPLFGQDRRPAVSEQPQENQRFLPVLGQGLGRQTLQAVERNLLVVQLVEKACQLRREADRLLVRHRRVAGTDQAGQQQPAADRPDRRRQRQLDRTVERQLALVRLADRDQARQQQRLAARGTPERLARGQAGAAAGQQHEGVGQTLAFPGQEPVDQCRQERAVGVDGMDAHHRAGA